jgi:serine carboxypeptidase-like clade 1
LDGRYVTVDEENGSELFYYFIESEGDPRSDPVVVWLTGGDRCSALSGLLLEIGQFVVL